MAGLFVSALDGLGPPLGGELLALDTVVAIEDRVDIESTSILSEICRQPAQSAHHPRAHGGAGDTCSSTPHTTPFLTSSR